MVHKKFCQFVGDLKLIKFAFPSFGPCLRRFSASQCLFGDGPRRVSAEAPDSVATTGNRETSYLKRKFDGNSIPPDMNVTIN